MENKKYANNANMLTWNPLTYLQWLINKVQTQLHGLLHD